MTKPTFHLRSLSATFLVLMFAGHPVLADDTEVMTGPGKAPNVLFIMDTSGSMNKDVAGNEPPEVGGSRLSIVQDVFEKLMNDSTNWGMNVALMRFDTDVINTEGGFFVSPMQTLNATNKDSIIAASNALTGDSWTPLAETLYEAARYYKGLSVEYGTDSVSGVLDLDTPANYRSPINSTCQKNYVVLLTDGSPSQDSSADSAIETMTGDTCDGDDGDNCLDEMAKYLHTVNQITGESDEPVTQTVETYTIGFTTSQTLLEDTASEGGGEYKTANNATELSKAFNDIFGSISASNNTFSPPALAANTFNGVSHFNKLYFALFEPKVGPKWNGNVKPYALNDDYQLVGADDNVATDADGLFKEGSISLWSTGADGASISTGGANDQLPSADDRKLYTYTGDYDTLGTLVLSNAKNALKNAPGSDLTAGMLGLSDPVPADLETDFNNVLDAVRSSKLGAPLHSQPALVTYKGTSESDVEQTLFVGTNDGFLHAINAGTGVEQFAFIPRELLTNLPTLVSGTGDIVYGLDGAITTWVKESDDDDHTIETGDGDHVYVYVGMRRGGNNYYALDVTEPDTPKLKWVIKGGIEDTDFEELGQTWSRPTLTTIKDDTVTEGTRKVLIFGGGYDTAQDLNPLGTADTKGRAVFIVDADTGERVWWAGPAGCAGCYEIPDTDTQLTNSIPSDVALLDSDRDGYTDRLYVGDMHGQVFRFDLNATLANSTGLRIANLGGTDAENNRRFYYPPDVVVTRNLGNIYVSLNIGSGYRAHPLNPAKADGTTDTAKLVKDRFYSLRDPYVVGPIPSDAPDFTDGASSNLFLADELVTSDDAADLAASTGWYINLGSGAGEKVLAPAITVNGEIFFTTYTPPATIIPDSCEPPPPGDGRLYRVSLFDAAPRPKPAVDDDDDSTTPDVVPPSTPDDRSTVLGGGDDGGGGGGGDDDDGDGGIPPGPAVIFREDGIGNCVGTECEGLPDAIQMQGTYWREGS